MYETNKQLCWTCKNAFNGCSWSKKFEPVEGWIAEEHFVRYPSGLQKTYNIKFCPQYIGESNE